MPATIKKYHIFNILDYRLVSSEIATIG